MLILQFIKYSEIEDLDSEKRIKKILDYVKKDKIVLLEGRLKKEEEAELIRKTMEEIDKKFKGIELAVIYPDDKANLGFLKKIKKELISILLGDRIGMTIVGPANKVTEIKQNPDKIELLTK
ncbi:DUF2073 domain-containing protein [Candidatus Woesearchaeota archaeon]|nr:DUF2073 domain-containing protein [Candidatus Woesearchaeota archaeon]